MAPADNVQATRDKHLASIDNTLRQILSVMQTLVAQAAASQPKERASDADLDSARGDEKIKKVKTRDWQGPPYADKKMSEAPAAFLEEYAGSFDYFAAKEDKEGEVDEKGEPKSRWSRRTAARARGWAARARRGLSGPSTSEIAAQAAHTNGEPASFPDGGWPAGFPATDQPADLTSTWSEDNDV